MKRILLLCIIGLLFLASCQQQPHPRIQLKRIQQENLGEEILTGYLQVKEDPYSSEGRFISIHFLVLQSIGADPKPDPIFVFAGGPGVGATRGILRWARMYAKFRHDRDIILIDERGTGKSNPLPCRPLGDPDKAQTWLGEMYPEDYLKNCRRELESRADLRYYNTSLAVDDFDRVRAALGYEKINVVGGSYGSRTGYLYMQRYPENVRCALLWAINPPEMSHPSTLAPLTERAMQRLLTDCESDPICQADYPKLRQEFEQILASLQPGPVTATIKNPFTQEPEIVTFGYTSFVTGIRSLLYSTSGSQWLPAMIHDAAQGNFNPLIEYTVGYLRSINEVYSDGLYLCVHCTEHEPYVDPHSAREAALGTFMGNYRLDQQEKACGLWVEGELPEGFFDLMELNIPTLVFSGELDPVTPVEFGKILISALPQSVHTVIPNTAHGLVDVWEDCLDETVNDFLSSGSIHGLDVSCIIGNQRPPFVSWNEYTQQNN